ncbi:hypothetical protein QAD02_000349 [Eretmocerus hayati]|uniref:Uncharacterized protein n=1 Tax=Eretmocerus hayati TaxID=131215 RepID=A0ACC2NHQ1_9HYME|nr:hypothetical protein QAD02_000349 [Eretmocerus hayati]
MANCAKQDCRVRNSQAQLLPCMVCAVLFHEKCAKSSRCALNYNDDEKCVSVTCYNCGMKMMELNSSHNASVIANNISGDHHMETESANTQGYSIEIISRLFDQKLAVVTQDVNANTNLAIPKISEDIKSLKTRVSTCEEHIEALYSRLDNHTPSGTAELASTVMYEIRNMDARRNNILMHGVPENNVQQPN